MDKNQDLQQQNQQGGLGRTVNSGTQGDDLTQDASNDISGIDQQEGFMSNGETGGGGALTQQSVPSNPDE